MSGTDLKTVESAYAEAVATYGFPLGETSTFVCPYSSCKAYAQHYWGIVNNLSTWLDSNRPSVRKVSEGTVIFLARCSSCEQEIIFHNNKMIMPQETQAPEPNVDIPAELVDDYEEARRVLPLSPRGAAALLRLVVQKLLPLIGAKEDDINKMIGQLVADGIISGAIQKALDSVRVIGNESVHPGVMNLKDDYKTAVSLFKLINFIVEKAITEPKEVEDIFLGLPPQKLAGIADRDKPKS